MSYRLTVVVLTFLSIHWLAVSCITSGRILECGSTFSTFSHIFHSFFLWQCLLLLWWALNIRYVSEKYIYKRLLRIALIEGMCLSSTIMLHNMQICDISPTVQVLICIYAHTYQQHVTISHLSIAKVFERQLHKEMLSLRCHYLLSVCAQDEASTPFDFLSPLYI